MICPLHVSTLIRHLQRALRAWLKLHKLLILINILTIPFYQDQQYM